MSNLKSTIEKLGRAQQGLVTAADSVDPAEWNNLPGLTCWSAAQLVAHLCQVERGVLAYADRVIRKTALPVTFFKRFHLPIALVESRIIKRKSPIAQEPELLGSKETMLAQLRSVRERTLAFLHETHGRDLTVATSIPRFTQFLCVVHICRRTPDSPYQTNGRNRKKSSKSRSKFAEVEDLTRSSPAPTSSVCHPWHCPESAKNRIHIDDFWCLKKKY